jgi:hypothetical protein
MMDFAMVPDWGPPRLLRFVPPERMPSDLTLAVLDHATNILMINNHLYDQLDARAQHQVLRTHETTTETTLEFA